MEFFEHQPINPTQPDRAFTRLTEEQKLRNTFAEIQVTRQQCELIVMQLEALYKQHRCLEWDILFLRHKLNDMASSLGLPPLEK